MISGPLVLERWHQTCQQVLAVATSADPPPDVGVGRKRCGVERKTSPFVSFSVRAVAAILY